MYRIYRKILHSVTEDLKFRVIELGYFIQNFAAQIRARGSYHMYGIPNLQSCQTEGISYKQYANITNKKTAEMYKYSTSRYQ